MPAQYQIAFPTTSTATKIVPSAAFQYLYDLVKAADLANGKPAPGLNASRIKLFATKGNVSAIEYTYDDKKQAIETLLAEEGENEDSGERYVGETMAGIFVRTDAAGAANGDSLTVRREF